MKRLTSKKTWDKAKQDLVHELGYQYIWERLNEIENILGDEYSLEHLKELVEKDKSQKSSSVYNHLPEEGQEVWYWDSYGISRGIVEFTNDTLNEFTVDFPDEDDVDIFYGCAWGDCIVASKEEALEKMKEGEE